MRKRYNENDIQLTGRAVATRHTMTPLSAKRKQDLYETQCCAPAPVDISSTQNPALHSAWSRFVTYSESRVKQSKPVLIIQAKMRCLL